jgi:hypothetical protein
VENEKPLEGLAPLSDSPHAVTDLKPKEVHTQGVVAASVVAGRVFLAGEELIRVEETFPCAGLQLVYFQEKLFRTPIATQR